MLKKAISINDKIMFKTAGRIIAISKKEKAA
jgi:hypothetical protein